MQDADVIAVILRFATQNQCPMIERYADAVICGDCTCCVYRDLLAVPVSEVPPRLGEDIGGEFGGVAASICGGGSQGFTQV